MVNESTMVKLKKVTESHSHAHTTLILFYATIYTVTKNIHTQHTMLVCLHISTLFGTKPEYPNGNEWTTNSHLRISSQNIACISIK